MFYLLVQRKVTQVRELVDIDFWPSILQAKPLPVDNKADPKKQKSVMTSNLLVVLY